MDLNQTNTKVYGLPIGWLLKSQSNLWHCEPNLGMICLASNLQQNPAERRKCKQLSQHMS